MVETAAQRAVGQAGKELITLSEELSHILQQDLDLPIEKVFAEAYRRQCMKG